MDAAATDASPNISKAETVSLEGIQRFEMKEHLTLGKKIGGLAVTYIGPNFLRHFGDMIETDVPARNVEYWTLNEWSLDQPLTEALDAPSPTSYLASLIQILELGPDGPGLFDGESNVHYHTSDRDNALWTPHWYVRGRRLGFGALPAGDVVGWEPGDRFFL